MGEKIYIEVAPGESTLIEVKGLDNAQPIPPEPPEPPTPTPGPGAGPSGIAMPTTPKAGWKFVGRADFDKNIALGSWVGDEDGVLQPRPDAARDGTYPDSSKRATYSAKKCISQHDGMLDCMGYQDANGRRWVGTPLTKYGTAVNLRTTECMKLAGPAAGWKIAHLVAVKGTGVAQRGEYDLPEAQARAGADGNGFIHQKGGAQTAYRLPPDSVYEWHTYTIEVRGGKSVTFELDGQQIGRITMPPGNLTTEAVHWVLQNETLLGGDPLPAQMGTLHVLTDWITIEVPA